MMSTSEQPIAVPGKLASQTKLIYLSLLITEEATAIDLQQLLELPKLTLLTVLESLVEIDLVRRTEDGYVSR